MTPRRAALLVIAMSVGAAVTAGAQRSEEARAGATALRSPKDSVGGLIGRLSGLPLWTAPIASAVIPGLGQARLGHDRFTAYMALEAYLIIQYVRHSNEGRENASTYRAIARDVARRGFPGFHPDTAWQYYEKLEKYDASGVFSKRLGGATVPETDPLTFNGQQWMLARQVYGIALDDPNPEVRAAYSQAVSYYETRAIPLAYAWNWVNASLERDLFVRAINRSNTAYRRATNDLIVLIANHIVSTIDAFSSLRLMQTRDGSFRAGTSIPVR